MPNELPKPNLPPTKGGENEGTQTDRSNQRTLDRARVSELLLRLNDAWSEDNPAERNKIVTELLRLIDPLIRRTAREFVKRSRAVFEKRHLALSADEVAQEMRLYVASGPQFCRSYTDGGEASLGNFLISVFLRRVRREFLHPQLRENRIPPGGRVLSLVDILGTHGTKRDKNDEQKNRELDIEDPRALAAFERIGEVTTSEGSMRIIRLLEEVDNPLKAMAFILRYGLGWEAFKRAQDRARNLRDELMNTHLNWRERPRIKKFIEELDALSALKSSDIDADEEHDGQVIGDLSGTSHQNIFLRVNSVRNFIKKRVKFTF